MDVLYSCHTLIFTFRYDKRNKRDCKKEDFARCFPTYIKEDARDLEGSDTAADYGVSKYFNEAAKRAMFTSSFEAPSPEIVLNYRCDLDELLLFSGSEGSADTVMFCIEKGEDKFELSLRDIRIKIYDNGIGMVLFYLNNYNHPDLESVVKINEYARRIYMPFVDDNKKCYLVADRIALKSKNKVIPCSESIINGNPALSLESEIPAFIKMHLIRDEEAEKQFRIKPMGDDRMFVACMYQNGSLVSELCEWDKDGNNYRYVTDALKYEPNDPLNAAGKFYKALCIDVGGISCQSRVMLKDYNEKHGYCRWTEYGTLYGISEYSMLGLCSKYDEEVRYLWDAFVYEYVEMAVLVLAQRATLRVLEEKVSLYALYGASARKMDRLHAKHIAFESKLLLQEITPQQQGIEIYALLSEHLLLSEEKYSFDKYISSLDNYSKLRDESRKSWILFIIAVLEISGVIFPIADLIKQICEGELLQLNFYKLGITIGFVILFIAFFCKGGGKHFGKK